MSPILLQPPFASTLVLALLAGLTGGYILIAHRKDQIGRLAGLGFSCLALAQFAATSIFAVTSDTVVICNATERLLAHGVFFIIIAIAYRFRGNPFPREARGAAFIAAGVWTVLTVSTILLLSTRPAAYPVPWESLIFPIWAIWGVVVCLRKAGYFERETAEARSSWLRPRDPRARAMRDLAVWFVLVIVPGLFSTLAYAGMMDYLAFYAGYTGLLLVANVYFVAIYFRHSPEPSSFSAKVMAVSLMTVLAVVGAGSLIVQTPRTLSHDAGIRLPEGRGIRLVPESGGGYTVREQPASFDAVPAESLPLGNQDAHRITLPFAFPFYGQTYGEAWIHDDGLLAFEPVAPRPWSHMRRLPEGPVVAPLYADFNLRFGGSVSLAQTPDRVVVTWHDVKGLRNLAPSTFQVVLHHDGRIDLAYGRLGLIPTNALRAIHPGGIGAGSIPFPEAQDAVSLPAGRTLLADYALRYRTFAHPREARFVWILLGSVALILTLFPLLIRAYVVRPLGALAEGVARMTAGERDVRVPVFYRDEVGTLADGFNRMTETLAEREEALRSLNASLQARVNEQTAELRQANERLRTLDRERSRFFANVSHEFRTPLTLILGPVERLLTEASLSPEQRRGVEGMKRSAQQLLSLVQELLDLARLDTVGLQVKPRPGNLSAWVRGLADAFVSTAEPGGVALQRRIKLSHPFRTYDPDVLEKIVTNLLSNAVKFTPRGGRVTLRAEDAGADVRFTVEDEGPGIDPKDVGRVFDRFYQADNTHGGTGLGLALVRELVEAYGGTVSVESEPGVGTTFEVRLPLPPAETAAGDEAVSAIPPAPLPPRFLAANGDAPVSDEQTAAPPDAPLVLIVEDHPDLRAFLRQALASYYRVREAADGEAAWTLARDERPDLVLTDVMMPGLDGHGLVARLRADEKLRLVPVIVLTAKADEAGRQAGFEAGVADYLFKPFNVQTLLARVANIVARHHELRTHYSQTFRLEASPVDVSSDAKALLDRVHTTIEEHIGDPDLKIGPLADKLGTSVRSLERALQEIGTTPLNLIRRLRMERAAMLLSDSRYAVKEAAAKVGYSHAGRFATHFKAVHGLTPTEYVRQFRQNEGAERDT